MSGGRPLSQAPMYVLKLSCHMSDARVEESQHSLKAT